MLTCQCTSARRARVGTAGSSSIHFCPICQRDIRNNSTHSEPITMNVMMQSLLFERVHGLIGCYMTPQKLSSDLCWWVFIIEGTASPHCPKRTIKDVISMYAFLLLDWYFGVCETSHWNQDANQLSWCLGWMGIWIATSCSRNNRQPWFRKEICRWKPEHTSWDYFCQLFVPINPILSIARTWCYLRGCTAWTNGRVLAHCYTM